jgi:putative membrane protein
MKNLWVASLALLASLALASCGAPSTPDFAQKVVMSDLYEVTAGKIASEKGQSEEVKQFGQQMVEAHSQTTQKLKGIVQAENIKVDLPIELDSTHKQLIDELNAASAADFDKVYHKQQVRAHKQAVDLFERYAKKGDNAAVKQFAAKMLPTIEEHLGAAKKLKS